MPTRRMHPPGGKIALPLRGLVRNGAGNPARIRRCRRKSAIFPTLHSRPPMAPALPSGSLIVRIFSSYDGGRAAEASMAGRRIRMQGTVQGVGFRPWVYRVAQAAAVTGRVRNDTAGVTIEAFGPAVALDAF